MTALEPSVNYKTLETRVNMTRAIQPNSGIYRCEGMLLQRGRQIITSQARVTGPDSKLYAHGTSTCPALITQEGPDWASRYEFPGCSPGRLTGLGDGMIVRRTSEQKGLSHERI